MSFHQLVRTDSCANFTEEDGIHSPTLPTISEEDYGNEAAIYFKGCVDFSYPSSWNCYESNPLADIAKVTRYFTNLPPHVQREELFAKFEKSGKEHDIRGVYGEVPAADYTILGTQLAQIAEETNMYLIMLGTAKYNPGQAVYMCWGGGRMRDDLYAAMTNVQELVDYLQEHRGEQPPAPEIVRRTMSFKHGVTETTIGSIFEPTWKEIESERKRALKQKIWDDALKKSEKKQ